MVQCSGCEKKIRISYRHQGKQYCSSCYDLIKSGYDIAKHGVPKIKSCPTCENPMKPWTYHSTPQWFCVKCEKPIFTQLPSFQYEFFSGKVSRKWNNKTQFFRMKIEFPKEKVGEQAAIYVGDAGKYLEMGRGDQIFITCEKKDGQLNGIYYMNQSVGQNEALIPTTTFVGKFKTGRFSSKSFEIPNPKLELALKGFQKVIDEWKKNHNIHAQT